MDISEIYKKDRLFNVTSTLSGKGDAEVARPLNFNGVAVLCEYSQDAVLPTEVDAFLNKVIEAGMKLVPAETLKVNLKHTDMTMQRLAEQIGAKRVIIFGTDWMESLKNGHIEKNEICSLFGMKVLVTDTLDVIQTNDSAKKIFWVGLKKMF